MTRTRATLMTLLKQAFDFEHWLDARLPPAPVRELELESIWPAYGLRPITAEILAKQQQIADAFLKVQIVPQAIDTNTAYLAKAGFTKQP